MFFTPVYIRYKSSLGKGSLTYPCAISGPLMRLHLRHTADLWALQGLGGIRLDQWTRAVSVFLHFTSLTSAHIIKEFWINLEGQKGNKHAATAKEEEWCLFWSLHYKRLSLRTLKSMVCVSVSFGPQPLLTCVLTMKLAFSMFCTACKVQCDTLQYRSKVNRM